MKGYYYLPSLNVHKVSGRDRGGGGRMMILYKILRLPFPLELGKVVGPSRVILI